MVVANLEERLDDERRERRVCADEPGRDQRSSQTPVGESLDEHDEHEAQERAARDVDEEGGPWEVVGWGREGASDPVSTYGTERTPKRQGRGDRDGRRLALEDLSP